MEARKTRYRYVTTDPPGTWWAVADTPEELQKAIRRGARFATWASLSDLPNGKNAPTRYGDFPLDFDDAEAPENALTDCRKLCLEILPDIYGVDPYAISFFASGSKGLHAVIPASLFGLENGHPDLPAIFKIIATDWADRFGLKTLDRSMYAGGKGKMFRLPNVRRANGRFKVPLALEEVRDLPMGKIMRLAAAPREVEPVEAITDPIPDLVTLAHDTIHEIERQKKIGPLSPPTLEPGCIPPCIRYILKHPPAKSDRVDFNRLTLLLATFAKAAGWTDEEAWQHVSNLVENYPHSATYDTPEKRRKKWDETLRFVLNRADYLFECSYVLGLRLPGSAFSCKRCGSKEGPEAPDGILEKLHRTLAVVAYSGNVYILAEPEGQNNPESGFELYSPPSLKLFYANQLVDVPTGKNGETKKVNPIDIWIRSPERRQYVGIVFDPSGKAPPTAYNLWKGLAITPDPSASCDRILEHIFEVICAGSDILYDYLIAWLAHLVREPGGGRPGTAIVLRGEQGTGKGSFVDAVGPIFGRHYLQIVQQSHLTGRFNSHLADKVLVFADEALWAGDKQAEGALKGLITEPRLTIEPKGKDAFQVANHVRLILASNSEWVVPAGLDDRRFVVLDVRNTYRRNYSYFDALHREIENGGRAGLLHYLLTCDLPGVNLREAPTTEGLIDQKIRTLDTTGTFWWDQLQDGDLWAQQAESGFLVKQDIYDAYAKACMQRRQRAESMTAFWTRTKTFIGEVRHTGQRLIGEGSTATRKRVVTLPPHDEALARFKLAVRGTP